MIKIGWTERELANAWHETMENKGGSFREFMDVLTAETLRDGCPAIYDIPSSGVDNIVARYDRVNRRSFTNVRALITTDKAREIAGDAAMKSGVPATDVAIILANVDEHLNAYKYGEAGK